MTAAEALEAARAAGVQLSATPEGKIRWRSRGSLPEPLRKALQAHKGELLARLWDQAEADRLIASLHPAWDAPTRSRSLHPLADAIDSAWLARDMDGLRQTVAVFLAAATKAARREVERLQEDAADRVSRGIT
jgi:hypothetical protein